MAKPEAMVKQSSEKHATWREYSLVLNSSTFVELLYRFKFVYCCISLRFFIFMFDAFSLAFRHGEQNHK